MASGDPETLRAVLSGDAPLPWQTPRIRALAAVLPESAEKGQFAGADSVAWPWLRLRTHLWPEILDRSVDGEPGWRTMAGACVAAVDILAGRTTHGSPAWPLAQVKSFGGDSGNSTLALGNEWKHVLERVAPSLPGVEDLGGVSEAEAAFARLRRPEVHAMLRGTSPARVLLARASTDSRLMEPEGADATRSLLRDLEPSWQDARWSIGVPSEGRSAMAAMVLRVLAEQRSQFLCGIGDVGISGELDEQGRLQPVAGLPEKVRRFFAAYPAGLCLVPAVQTSELEALRPEPWSYQDWERRKKADPTRLGTRQWQRMVPIVSVRHLLGVLGERVVGDHASLRVIQQASARSRTVSDWRGRLREVASLAELPMRRMQDQHDETRRFHTLTVGNLVLAPWGEDQSLPSRRRIVLTGRPGSGKSMVLRQLHYALCVGDGQLRGPSLMLPARRLVDGRGLAHALAEDLDVTVDYAKVVLEDEHLTPATWLLLDGLDELPLADRRRVVALVDRWPGPAVVATRGLPEQLPAGDVVVVEDLEPRRAADVLAAEDRNDLAEALRDHRGYRAEADVDPLGLLRGELARTPLGVSLLAMVWKGEPTSRQALLRDAVLHLVRRAEAAGRLSAAARRRFERQGLRLLGAAAWRMLDAGRAILAVEDLEVAERLEGLRPDEGDLMHEAVEHGGFVQPVGPGAWEFSHKSFAELAAARYLLATGGGEAWAGPVAKLGDPSADEVLLHLATMVGDAGPLLEDLLSRQDRWLSALRLSTRVLLEIPPSAVPADLLLRVLRARLRVWCALPDQPLPGGLSGIEDVKRAIERHGAVLAARGEELLGACPEVVQRWARDPDGESARLEAEQKRRWETRDFSSGGEDNSPHELVNLGRWLNKQLSPPDRSLAALLRTEGGRAELKGRGAGAWLQDLEALFDDREIGSAARELWWALTPDEQVLSMVGHLHPAHRDLEQILRVVARVGTPGQRREALVRATLALGESTPLTRRVVSGTAELSAKEVAALWAPAWSCGVLAETGRTRAGDSGRERLLSSFLDDELPEARWRALVALRAVLEAEPASVRPTYGRERELKPPPPGLVLRLLRLLNDSSAYVCAEALAWLGDGGVRLPWAVVVPLILGGPPPLRLVAFRAALVGRDPLPMALILHALSMLTLGPDSESGGYDQPPQLPWVKALRGHADNARADLVTHLRQACSTWPGLVEVVETGADIAVEPLLGEILGLERYGVSRDAPGSIVRRALQSEQVLLRRWGAARLGWQTEKAVSEALVSRLTDDSDSFVAERAREEKARRTPEERRPAWQRLEPVMAPGEQGVDADDHANPGELDETALHMPLGFGSESRTKGRTVSIQAVLATTGFDEAWDLLGHGALETKLSSDMEGAWLPDNEDRFMEYALQAADENRQVIRQAFEHLRSFYGPKLRPRLIRDLGHPSRGLFAKFLLSLEPCGRELLPAVHQNAKAAHRVAELARGTPLSLAVIDELVAGIADGSLELVVKEHRWGRDEPELMRTLRQFGGREALFRLVYESNVPSVRELAIDALLDARQPTAGEVADSAAAALRGWVRRQLDDGGDRVRLLQILALCGNRDDIEHWRSGVDAGELGEKEAVAVARLVGHRGELAEASWLRRLALTTESAKVLLEVAQGLDRLGGEENARWLMERLDDPPPCVARTRAAWSAWSERRDALHDEARASGRTDYWNLRPEGPEPPHEREASEWEHPAHVAILRHGDDELGMKLAWRLAGSMSAIELCEKYGRLPSHALFVLGAIENDPGEQVVGGDGEMAEAVGSGVPERVRQAVGRIVEICAEEPVRRVLLVAMLSGYGGDWGSGESYGLLESIFFELGGPKRGDLGALLSHLDQHPYDTTALRYLARMNIGERELLDLWRKHEAPWLEPS
ncbi:MAG: hypothetical protein H6741_27865 [Alphaproteobacteria bacterium]|nr:hypothetical protein [Alphaproteobacteria bacterium]MCB9796532.1 hypothetical protein [Alphaproteobacteria bacterium]